MTDTITKEILSRTRRIETRLTQFMIAQGVDTFSQKAAFAPSQDSNVGHIAAPSGHCSIKELLDSVPEGWHGRVDVFVGGDRLTTLVVD